MGLRLRIRVSGFRVLGFRVLGFRVLGFQSFRVMGLRFRIRALSFGVESSRCQISV